MVAHFPSCCLKRVVFLRSFRRWYLLRRIMRESFYHITEISLLSFLILLPSLPEAKMRRNSWLACFFNKCGTILIEAPSLFLLELIADLNWRMNYSIYICPLVQTCSSSSEPGVASRTSIFSWTYIPSQYRWDGESGNRRHLKDFFDWFQRLHSLGSSACDFLSLAYFSFLYFPHSSDESSEVLLSLAQSVSLLFRDPSEGSAYSCLIALFLPIAAFKHDSRFKWPFFLSD